MYIKYYCGPKTADVILKKAIRPFVKSLRNKKLIQKWFFVRYADPENHIRVRVHLTDVNYLNEALELNRNYIKPFEKNNLVWKIQLDTYNRELERYANLIEESEEIFYYDSFAVLEFMNSTAISVREKYAWLWAMRGIENYFNVFAFDVDRKIQVLKDLKEAYYQEFKVDKALKHQIDAKFRKHRTDIERILTVDCSCAFPEIPFDLLEKRSCNIKPIVSKILATNKNPECIDDLIKSYIHMFLNRSLPNTLRFQETMIYDFGWRHYRSLRKRDY